MRRMVLAKPRMGRTAPSVVRLPRRQLSGMLVMSGMIKGRLLLPRLRNACAHAVDRDRHAFVECLPYSLIQYFFRTAMKILQMLWVCAVLTACASAPVPPPELHPSEVAAVVKPVADLSQTYADLRSAGGRMFMLNPKTSTLRMVAFRGGKAAKFGHNHVLSVPEFQGYFSLAPDGTAASRFDLVFRLDQLVFDVPAHRAALGPAFASTISEEDRASTRTNMLGDNNFQASRFPFLRIQSLQIVGDAPKFAAKIAVELHGQTRDMWTALTVTGLPEQLTVKGALVLKQTDFGIKPFSVFGGMLAVQDEVVIEFTLVGDAP